MKICLVVQKKTISLPADKEPLRPEEEDQAARHEGHIKAGRGEGKVEIEIHPLEEEN